MKNSPFELQTRTLPPTDENLKTAARLIQAGQVVGMPTETVYGLAGDALNPDALARIFSVKERPTFDPLILHIAMFSPFQKNPIAALESLQLIRTDELSELARVRAQALMLAFWPGPMTLVLPKHPHVPDLATAGLKTVALRMPRHPIAQALLDRAGTPLAAPSANRFGRISPTRPEHVVSELSGRIECIIDGGPCEIGVESTVVQIDPSGNLILLRPGGVSVAELEQAAETSIKTAPVLRNTEAQNSPGMLESHYAPLKSLLILPAPLAEMSSEQVAEFFKQPMFKSKTVGMLLLMGSADTAAARIKEASGFEVFVRSLSPSRNLEEVAHYLFSELRELDQSSAQILVAEPCSFRDAKAGLGFAISDRLHRASISPERFS